MLGETRQMEIRQDFSIRQETFDYSFSTSGNTLRVFSDTALAPSRAALL